MISAVGVLVLLALVCFVLVALNVHTGQINCLGLGLFFLTLAFGLTRFTTLTAMAGVH